jgi:hypothetical protein
MNSIGLRVLLLIGRGVPAGLEAASDVGSQVKELLEVTGMAESLRSLPSMARHQGAAIGGTDELGNAFQEAFVSSFEPEPILERTDVCSGVPPLEDLQQTVLWRLQQCASLGREDAFCRTLMGSLQRHCVESKDSVGTWRDWGRSSGWSLSLPACRSQARHPYALLSLPNATHQR